MDPNVAPAMGSIPTEAERQRYDAWAAATDNPPWKGRVRGQAASAIAAPMAEPKGSKPTTKEIAMYTERDQGAARQTRLPSEGRRRSSSRLPDMCAALLYSNGKIGRCRVPAETAGALCPRHARIGTLSASDFEVDALRLAIADHHEAELRPAKEFLAKHARGEVTPYTESQLRGILLPHARGAKKPNLQRAPASETATDRLQGLGRRRTKLAAGPTQISLPEKEEKALLQQGRQTFLELASELLSEDQVDLLAAEPTNIKAIACFLRLQEEVIRSLTAALKHSTLPSPTKRTYQPRPEDFSREEMEEHPFDARIARRQALRRRSLRVDEGKLLIASCAPDREQLYYLRPDCTLGEQVGEGVQYVHASGAPGAGEWVRIASDSVRYVWADQLMKDRLDPGARILRLEQLRNLSESAYRVLTVYGAVIFPCADSARAEEAIDYLKKEAPSMSERYSASVVEANRFLFNLGWNRADAGRIACSDWVLLIFTKKGLPDASGLVVAWHASLERRRPLCFLTHACELIERVEDEVRQVSVSNRPEEQRWANIADASVSYVWCEIAHPHAVELLDILKAFYGILDTGGVVIVPFHSQQLGPATIDAVRDAQWTIERYHVSILKPLDFVFNIGWREETGGGRNTYACRDSQVTFTKVSHDA